MYAIRMSLAMYEDEVPGDAIARIVNRDGCRSISYDRDTNVVQVLVDEAPENEYDHDEIAKALGFMRWAEVPTNVLTLV